MHTKPEKPTSLLALYFLLKKSVHSFVYSFPFLFFYGLLFYPFSLKAQFSKFRTVFNDDPATTTTIAYVSIEAARLYYDTLDRGNEYWNYNFHQMPNRSQWSKNMKHHFVRLKNLRANTKYYFVISDGNHISQQYWFRTFPNNSHQRLSFIVGGDNRRIAPIYEPDGRRNGNKMVAKLRADAVLFTGDMTIDDTSEEWQVWLEDWQLSIAADGRITPIVVTRGNHEYHISENSLYNIFDLPQEEAYYALSFGGDLLRVYTLDSNISIAGDQADWLEGDLSENTCTYWKLAQYHHPIRPHSHAKSDRDWQRDEWARRFDAYGVQIAAEGDVHLHKITHPILVSDDWNHPTYAEGFIRDDYRGVTYLGEGGWGATLRLNDDNKNWTIGSGSFNQFKWMFVDRSKIEIRTILIDNPDVVLAKTEADSKFTEPEGLALWENDHSGKVLTLTNANNPLRVDLPTSMPLFQNSTTQLNAGAGFESYIWNTGDTICSIFVSEPGTYSVTVSNRGRCESSDDIHVIGIPHTGFDTIDSLQIPISNIPLEISDFFPNPVKNCATVNIHSFQAQQASYSIINSKGQQLFQQNIFLHFGVNPLNLVLNNFEKGIYFLVITQKTRKTVKKFIKH